MNPKMRKYMMDTGRRMRIDGRNPYGSRGGYVVPGHDRSYEHGRDYGQSYYEGEFRGMSDHRMDGRRMDRNYDERRFRDYGDYNEDYRRKRDYHDYPMSDYGGGFLNHEELHAWKRMLCDELDKAECEMFSDEKIMKRAKENGIKFDDFTDEEFIITVVMLYTDYGKTLGKANVDTYVKMANDFLCDKDAGVKGGEKLTAYFDNIVNV